MAKPRLSYAEHQALPNKERAMRWTVSHFQDQLADRKAIRHCLLRYARGVDRIDEDLLRSVYWEDATDEHAGMF
jgi:hypothetical protein